MMEERPHTEQTESSTTPLEEHQPQKRLDRPVPPDFDPEDGIYHRYPDFFYSGFWIRSLAFIIDSFIAAAIIRILLHPLFLWLSPEPESTIARLYPVLGAILYYAYFVLMTYFTNGQTLGKMIFGLRVISFREEKLGFVTCLIREGFGRSIYSFGITGLLYVIAAFTRRKQHFVDLLMDTSVITENVQKASTIYREVETPLI